MNPASDPANPPRNSPHVSTQAQTQGGHSPNRSFNLRTSTTPETDLILPSKSKHTLSHPQSSPQALEAANVPAPRCREYYSPQPSTSYYPPVETESYDRDGNLQYAPPQRQRPYEAPRRGSNEWVWEYAPWGFYDGQWSPRLYGFRTRNMPPSQIACLFIPLLVLATITIAVSVVLVQRHNAGSMNSGSG